MPGPAALLSARLRQLSWAQILFLSQQALRRGSAIGRELGPNGRARIVELVRKSNGRPGNLSRREQDELKELARAVFDAAVHPERH